MLAGGDVARGNGGGVLSPPAPTPPHLIPEKSALGRGIGGAKAGKRLQQTESKDQSWQSGSQAMGYFFKSLINEYFLEISLWH